MGWRELGAYQRSMAVEKQGAENDPYTWAGDRNNPFWAEAAERRRQIRGG